MSIAVILPTLNEEEAVGKVIEDIPDEVNGIETEAFVIDGGSEDDTVKIAKNSGAQIIEQSFEGGKGSAMRESLEKIDGEAYVFMDADMTYPPEEMNKLVKPVIEGEADHVMGSRLDQREEGAFMYRNLIGNKAMSWFLRKLTDTEIQDFFTGYRALSPEIVEELDLDSKGFEIETELNMKTIRLDAEIEEVSITYRPRVGESKLDFKTDGPKLFLYSLKLAFLD